MFIGVGQSIFAWYLDIEQKLCAYESFYYFNFMCAQERCQLPTKIYFYCFHTKAHLKQKQPTTWHMLIGFLHM